ncbi:MAG: GGDEF domain-containing protein [Arcobacteraceae bacterium]|nr:GGDEF domain-containing protein [Arcobacteraceae bacterium]
MHYNFYKKIYKTYPKLKNILIENSDYIDKNDLINEFSKSTPLMMEKEKIDTHKFNLTFKFFDKSNINDSYIEKKIVSLEDNEYLQGFEKKSIYLFGKIYNDGYVLIVKQLQQNSQILSIIENLFIKIFFVGFINIFLLLYLFNLIKNQESTKEQLFREFEQLQLDTKKVAFEDTLTGAATRLKFDETLKDLVNIASRFKEQKFTAIMIDIDNFKKVNDTYGHDYGDIVLKEVAKVVQKHIRKTDTFARWGGEEFVILSPMNNLKDSFTFADKIRKLIANIDFKKLDRITCSFGLTEFRQGDTEQSLMKRADELLYKAKQNGKNRVEYQLIKLV